jgi:hypothetical protein
MTGGRRQHMAKKRFYGWEGAQEDPPTPLVEEDAAAKAAALAAEKAAEKEALLASQKRKVKAKARYDKVLADLGVNTGTRFEFDLRGLSPVQANEVIASFYERSADARLAHEAKIKEDAKKFLEAQEQRRLCGAAMRAKREAAGLSLRQVAMRMGGLDGFKTTFDILQRIEVGKYHGTGDRLQAAEAWYDAAFGEVETAVSSEKVESALSKEKVKA